MLGAVLKETIARTKVDPKLVEDIAVGNVLPPGGGATVARMAALWAGFPSSTAVNTLNRQCSSGLAAVNQIANQIALGQIDIGVGECKPAPFSIFSSVHNVDKIRGSARTLRS